MKKYTLILLGHGSKSAEAVDDFNFITSLVKEKLTDAHVYGAHMELSEPGLNTVVEQAYAAGQRNFMILPYFLFNGMHIKKDIPDMLEALRSSYSDATFTFGKPIGKEAMMADLLIKQAHEMAV